MELSANLIYGNNTDYVCRFQVSSKFAARDADIQPLSGPKLLRSDRESSNAVSHDLHAAAIIEQKRVTVDEHWVNVVVLSANRDKSSESAAAVLGDCCAVPDSDVGMSR